MVDLRYSPMYIWMKKNMLGSLKIYRSTYYYSFLTNAPASAQVHLDIHLYFNTRGHVNYHILDLFNCFISSQSAHNRLMNVHLTGSKKAYISGKKNIYIIFWEVTVYIHLYLFTILYFDWITTNIVKYLTIPSIVCVQICLYSLM